MQCKEEDLWRDGDIEHRRVGVVKGEHGEWRSPWAQGNTKRGDVRRGKQRGGRSNHQSCARKLVPTRGASVRACAYNQPHDGAHQYVLDSHAPES